MKKMIEIDVVGGSPPCKRCEVTWKNVNKAVSMHASEDIDVVVRKVDIVSIDVISRYGVLMSPAVVVNGAVKINGRVPDVKEIEAHLKNERPQPA